MKSKILAILLLGLISCLPAICVQVYTPNAAGLTFHPGNYVLIKWFKSTEIKSVYVVLEDYENGGSIEIACVNGNTAANPGTSYSWKIPENLSGHKFKIKIIGGYNSHSYYDQSDNFFQILPSNPSSINDVETNNLNLSQNYPNPFNNTTSINFNLSHDTFVNLTVYNTKGEIVKQLINDNCLSGQHTVDFDATNLNSGVYFYKLQTKEKAIIKQMILVK